MRRCIPASRLPGNPTYQTLRAVSDPQLAMFRVAMMPPKSSGEAVTIMRTAFAEMWKDPQFLADYSKVIKTEPILVSGAEGQEVLNGLATRLERDQRVSRQIHQQPDQQIAVVGSHAVGESVFASG